MPRPFDDEDTESARGGRLRRWGRSLINRSHDDDRVVQDLPPEQAQRDAAERDAAEREAAEREAAEREAAEREAAEAVERDAAAAREQAEQDAASTTAREQAQRDAAAREQAEREQTERDNAARETAERQAATSTAATAGTPTPHVPPPLMARPAATLPHESVLQPWVPGPRGARIVLDKLEVATNRRQVHAALVEGINAEGPIHIERLARLIAASFEVRKLSPSRVTDIAAVIPKSTVRTEDGTVCWPVRIDPAAYESFRSSPEPELRPTEHIPRHELANAMRDVVELQGPTPTAELFGITRRIFGGKRVTANVEARMTSALDEAVTESRLVRDGDLVDIA